MNNWGTKYGILAGSVTVVYYLLFYFIDPQSMLHLGVGWSSLLIYALAMYWAVRRTQQGGTTLAFRSALSVTFRVVVIANLLYCLFYYILMNTDMEMLALLKEKSIEFYKEWQPDMRPNQVEEMHEGFAIGISDTLLTFARSTIGGFGLAAIMAVVATRRS